jgi:hypothetical protein
MGISGEVDLVKPTTNSKNLSNSKSKQYQSQNGSEHSLNMINSTLGKNGINITQEQLEAILNSINSNDNKLNNRNNKSISFENLNSNSNNDLSDDIKLFKPPHVVVYDEPDSNHNRPKQSLTNNTVNNAFDANKSSSLMDKKRLKWQQDLGLFDFILRSVNKYSKNLYLDRNER